MLLDHFIPISIGLSLGVVTLILTVAVAASLVRARREKRRPPHA
jgi:hypothetical protein